MTEQSKPCLRCLLEDLDEDEFVRSLKEHIRSVPADRRVDGDVYRERLALCRECDRLINGMCAECGCYAELRALKPGADCASPVKRWLPVK